MTTNFRKTNCKILWDYFYYLTKSFHDQILAETTWTTYYDTAIKNSETEWNNIVHIEIDLCSKL